MVGELQGRPEEAQIFGMGRSVDNRLDKELRHQEIFEEDSFTRVQLNKVQKKRRRRLEQEREDILSFRDQGREFDDLQAFRALQQGLEDEEGGGPPRKRQKRSKGPRKVGWKRKGKK